MCGIVGYVGDKNAVTIIVDGLRRLEYRGYDSAGVAVLDADGMQVRRAPGRLKALESVLREKPVTGSIGIGHTRWATHGRPSEENAHPHTRDVVILEDNDMAVVTAHGVELTTVEGDPVQREPVKILWDPIMAEKGGYRHFMLKEIYEQPRAITDTFRGRIAPETGSVILPDVSLDPSTVKAIQRVVLVACGTAWHAATLTRMMIERLAGIPAEVDLASEFRYRDAIVGPETLVIAVSQSGETADTIGAVKAARLKGCPILAVTNVVGSALAREATGVLQMHAGPEIGVASTKAFSTMIVASYLLGLWLGRQRGALTSEDVKKRIHELVEIPRLVEKTLELDGQMEALARQVSDATDFLYLGRGVQFPIALEGALKLKEISYIHAEGYAGGEMKHGPIALIADGLPVLALVPRDGSYERMLGNIEEVRARDGLVVAVAHAGDRNVAAKAKHVIEVPPCAELLAPLITVVPLQLLAYHIAVRLGCDVDQPRNLAKSVTVE